MTSGHSGSSRVAPGRAGVNPGRDVIQSPGGKVVWWMMVGSLAMANGGGGDTGTDPGTGTTTDSGVSVNDTVCDIPENCSTAGDLAKEKGGNPCTDGSEGCDSTGGGLPALAVIAVAGWAIRRREIRPTRR